MIECRAHSKGVAGGEPKYGQLGIPYTWQGEEPDPQHIKKLEGIIQDTGLQVSVGS